MSQNCPNIYEFQANLIDGEKIQFSSFKGELLLIVNTASKCMFTPQYSWLEELHRKYCDDGLQVLGFPCDQFGGQEPDENPAIQYFCELNFSVSFKLFEKVQVNGPNAHPLFQYLCDKQRGLLGSKSIKWNFTKFLISRSGEPLARFAPNSSLDRIEPEIRRQLKL